MAMSEQEIQQWFDRIDAQPGVFDGLRESGAGNEISPSMRIHELFLKRLFGQYVGLWAVDTTEFGTVHIDIGNYIDFDYMTLARDGFVTKLPFTSDAGVQGEARIDWKGLDLILIPDADDVEQYYHYTIGLLINHAISRAADGRVCIDLMADLVYKDSAEQFPNHRVLEHSPLSRLYIECGVLNQGSDGGFMPSRTPTLKAISEITGVTASTLSNLKNGKRKIENLSYETFAILSQFGYMRNLDDMIYAALQLDRRAEATAQTSTVDADGYRLAVVTDDAVYYIDQTSLEAARDRLREIDAMFAGEIRSLFLEDIYVDTADGRQMYPCVSVPIGRIQDIRVEPRT